MDLSFSLTSYFIMIILIIFHLVPTMEKTSIVFLSEFVTLGDISDRIRTDHEAIEMASSDFGNIVKQIPAAVLYPSSIKHIQTLIKFANVNSSVPFCIAARGRSHSVRGQALVHEGVVVDMKSLKRDRNGTGIKVSGSHDLLGYYYADVGGEQLWIDVLHATSEHGLAPVSWTDYLYLTVGGTLSNAGISGQTSRYGPQISNVLELDVVTGKGEFVTCSRHNNSELFYAVLGGLGQFGIITRARIALAPAPERVKWIRILYYDFSAFTRDQERLISINGSGLDYLEGSLLMHLQGPSDNWKSSFFPPSDYSRIISLVTKHGIIYCLEVAKYYDDLNQKYNLDKELQVLFKGLSFIPGFMYEKDVSHVDFLNRVREEELMLESQGLWDVPHPWLNLFVPKSRILDFNSGVFRDIVLKRNITTGLVLVYPMNKNKWNDKMSAVIPDEDIFYTVGFLYSSGFNEYWEAFDDQNREILNFCDRSGIKIKQYLPNYTEKSDWINHFGSKWNTFQERKAQFDPKMILSPGHRIFNKL